MARRNKEKRAAVLGFPVRHSLSPRLHNYWMKRYNIDGEYEALEVEPSHLGTFLRSLPEGGFSGVNLTIPHKEHALKFVEVDELARRIGAVNTIVVDGGRLRGINTDAYGFIQNLKAQAADITCGKAVVMGTGGAARAVCVGLLEQDWEVTLVNRTHEKAEALTKSLRHGKLNMAAWENRKEMLADATLLVNTTALGMKGQPALELPLQNLPAGACVYDIVYSPLSTPLLEDARARGCRIITGLGMLLYQAQPAFEAWFGVRPEVTPELHEYMLEALT